MIILLIQEMFDQLFGLCKSDCQLDRQHVHGGKSATLPEKRRMLENVQSRAENKGHGTKRTGGEDVAS